MRRERDLFECLYCTKKSDLTQHFTVIGITKLLGGPMCCVLIIEDKEELFDIIYRIIFSREKVGDESDREE